MARPPPSWRARSATPAEPTLLEAAQVPGWWVGVEQLSNRTASAYLRALLLTGARREELAALTWANGFSVAQADYRRQGGHHPNHSTGAPTWRKCRDPSQGWAIRVCQHGQGRANHRRPRKPCPGPATRWHRTPDIPRVAPFVFATGGGRRGTCWGYRTSNGAQAKRNSRGLQAAQY